MTDISDTLAPNSAQLNAVDLLGGPITVTVTDVDIQKAREQPAYINLAEFPGRTYRPSLTMRRLLVECWGPRASSYVGRQMTLFREPSITWAGKAVGGIVISHVSHIDSSRTLTLPVAQNKWKDFTVRPLEATPDPVEAWAAALSSCESTEALASTWTEIQAARLSTNERLIRAKDDRKQYLSEPI